MSIGQFEWDVDDPFLKSPEFLALNPAGSHSNARRRATSLVSESLAINLYLAKTYGAALGLYPADADAGGEAQVWRWTLAGAQGHLEPWVQQDAALASLRAAVGEEGRKAAARGLGLLETVLGGQEWMLGRTFTVADLNVAGVLVRPRARRGWTSHTYPAVVGWLARCYRRPAAVEMRANFV